MNRRSFTKALLSTALMMGVGAAVQAEAQYQFIQKINGLKSAAASSPETPSEPGSLIFHLDYSLESNATSVTDRVSGQFWATIANSVVADAEGKLALIPKMGSGIPSQTFETQSNWTLEVEFAPPYVTPNVNAYGGVFQLLKGSNHIIGIYRDGYGNTTSSVSYDGSIYQAQGLRSNDSVTGSASWLNYTSAGIARLRKKLTAELRTAKWQRVGDTVSIFINEEEIATFPAESSDVISGGYSIMPANNYTNSSVRVRSYKLWGD